MGLLKEAISHFKVCDRGFEFHMQDIAIINGFVPHKGCDIEYYVGLSAEHLEGGRLCPHINWMSKSWSPKSNEVPLSGELEE